MTKKQPRQLELFPNIGRTSSAELRNMLERLKLHTKRKDLSSTERSLLAEIAGVMENYDKTKMDHSP